MRTVYGLFTGYAQARAAVDELSGRGIDERQLNVVVAADAGRGYLKTVRGLDLSRQHEAKSAALGGRSLFGLDALLAGRQPVRMADVGAVLAGGEMATIVVKSREGEDCFLGDEFRELGLKRAEAEALVSGIKLGKILVWVRCEDMQASGVREVFATGEAERTGTMR